MKKSIKKSNFKKILPAGMMLLLGALIPLIFLSCPNSVQPDGGVSVTGVTLNYASIWMLTTLAASIGGEVQLVATIEPVNATNKKVSWSSTDSSIASVSQNGLVQMIDSGSVWIRALTEDGNYSADCSIIIPPPPPVYPDSITLETDSILMLTGETRELDYEILPADATILDVTWQSGNESVIDFTASNELVAVGAGSTNVTVKTANYKQDQCFVRVVDEIVDVTGVTLPETLIVPTNGADVNRFLEASITPDDATFPSVQWSGYDENLITVIPNGMNEKACTVSANSGVAGTTTLTATSDDSGLTADCTVEVIIPAESITFINIDEETNSITVQPNNTYQVEIATVPENITTNLNWTIQGSGMTIDQNGLITVGDSPDICYVKVRDGYYDYIGPSLLNVLVE